MHGEVLGVGFYIRPARTLLGLHRGADLREERDRRSLGAPKGIGCQLGERGGFQRFGWDRLAVAMVWGAASSNRGTEAWEPGQGVGEL